MPLNPARAPVTLAFLIAAALSYALNGPATGTLGYQSFAQLLSGTMRHGNPEHLLVNLALLGWGGFIVEPRLGSATLAALSLLTLFAGTALELAIIGPGFVGISGLAYGYAACAIVLTTAPQHRGFALLMVAGVLAAEKAFLSDNLSIFAHISGVALIAGYPMLKSLFGPKGPTLIPMKWEHVSPVVAIINQTDEDDAAEAEEMFMNSDFQNMYVLANRGTVMGVTGFGIDEQVPDLAWLSWTYLSEEYLGQGYGAQMLNDLLGKLNQMGIRKIFIETSDYEEDGEKIYANAHRLYEEFGAGLELTIPDYHAPGEAKLIFGLNNPEAPAVQAEDREAEPGLALTGMDRAAETDDVAGFRWEETPTGLSGVDFAVDRATEGGFRMAVLAIPADLSSAHAEALSEHGFRRLGELPEYYSSDLGQDWWAKHLTPDPQNTGTENPHV